MASVAISTVPSPGRAPCARLAPLGKGGRDAAVEVSFWIAAAITLVLAIVPAVLWSGDVTWIDDEPALILNAFVANSEHHLAAHGLFGSFPVPYGPLPTEIYQLCLLFTHDLRIVVAIRAGLSAAVFAGSLLWLARTLRLMPWFAAAVVVGPYLWNDQRVLWDCSFLIPISTFAVAAYAAYLRRRSGALLVIALTAVTLAPLIHLQALPTFAVIVGHACWRFRPELRRLRRWLVGAGVGVVCLNAGYVIWLTACVLKNCLNILWFGHSDHRPIWQAIIGPIWAGRMLAAPDFIHGLPSLHAPAGLVSAAMLGSQIILPLIWLGIILCAVREYRRWSVRRRELPDQLPRVATFSSTRSTLATLALAALGAQLFMVIVLRIPPWLHYCFGTLPFHLLFAWFAVEFLRHIWLGLLTVVIWGASLGFLLVAADWQIHHDGYPPGNNSPLLTNQMQVADQLSHYGDLLIWTDVPLYHSYPGALQVLRLLAGHHPGCPLSPGPLLVRFVPDPTGHNGRIELVHVRSKADLPKGSKRLDLGPPTNW